MSKAVLFFADGTEECEALLVADLLRRARVEVIIASAMGRRALVSSHGIHLNADALAEDVDYSDVDMVILPGGIPGTPNLAENRPVTDTCVSFLPKAGQEGRRHLRRAQRPRQPRPAGRQERHRPTPDFRTSWPVPSSTMKKSS